MLAKTYRFRVGNTTDETLAIGAVTIKGIRHNFNSQATISYESSEAALYSNTGTIADAAFEAGGTIDNSSDLYLGGHFELTATAPGTPDGNVTVYLERSTDGGTTWDTAGLGDIVAAINFTSASTQVKSFEI